MNNIIKITLLNILLVLSHNLSAQITSGLGDAKQKAYNSKVNKSPAKEEIITTDKALEEIERFKDWSAQGIYKSDNKYKIFVTNYEIVEKHIPLIKEKDPKWKIEKQNERWFPYKDKYVEVKRLQKQYEELESAFNTYDEYFKAKAYALKQKSKACGYSSSGRMDLAVERRIPAVKVLEQFVYGNGEDDLQWKELKAKVLEFEKIIESYKKEYEAKGGMVRDIYSNALKVFTEGKYESPEYFKGEFVSFQQKISMYDSKPSFEDFPGNLIRSNIDRTTAKVWLHIFPDDSALRGIYDKIDAYSSDLDAKFRKDIAQSDFHASIIEGVYFSDHPIIIGQETEADFKTKFKSTDPIYMTVYYAEKYNMCEKNVEIIERSKGKKMNLRYFPFGLKSNCVEMNSVVQVTLIPPSIEEGKPIYHSVLDLLRFLKSVDSDELTLEISKEEITLDFSEGNEKYNELHDALLKYRTDNLSAPKAKMSFSLSLAKACDEEGFKESLVKVVPVETDWEYEKNVYGVIISREIDAVLLFKDSNGKCFLRDVTIYQEKNESGYASPVLSNVSNYYQQEVNADQVILHGAEDDDYRIYYNCK